MRLLYVGAFMFHKEDGRTFTLPSCSDNFFEKYFPAFDYVRVIGDEIKSNINFHDLVEMKNSNISVRILKHNTHPKDFINDVEIKKCLREEIVNADAVLVKPATRKGQQAIKIAEQMNKPYMIEMTGDIHNALQQSPNILRRMYAPFLYRQIIKAIKKCKFGLYVSQYYLQKKYPISGVMCGCADVVINNLDITDLNDRLQKIDLMRNDSEVNLALIGFYHGNGKGVDTAIRGLARLDDRIKLNILGNGTEENRRKWYAYADKHGVARNRIFFPKPLSSSLEVCKWLKNMDIFVLPSRSEGFGRCIIEAMSVACPCIATNICTIPELVSKEWLIPLDGDVEFADRVNTLINNKELMKSVAKSCFKTASEYEFDKLRLRRQEFLLKFRNYVESINVLLK